METRAMKRNNVTVEDKEAATILANLHKDNNIMKQLKKDKEEQDREKAEKKRKEEERNRQNAEKIRREEEQV